jgi:RNA polymerase sigma-70 factor (ECF subfamily)
MTETSLSLLDQLCLHPDAAAWQRLAALYTPLLHGWLRRYEVQQSDADDLVQDVFTVLVRELPHFQRGPQAGSFRSWLRTILVNRLRNFWRSRQARPLATGDSAFPQMLDQLEDPASGLSQIWNREHDLHLVHRALDAIASEFAPATLQAFRLVSLEGRSEEEAAAAVGISVNAVFIAKSRVLNRLRREMAGFMD